MGLFGCWTGAVAKRKGYGYGKAFLLGFGLPIMLGVISVGLVYASGGRGCGGIVCLIVAFLVFMYYSLAKRKDLSQQA